MRKSVVVQNILCAVRIPANSIHPPYSSDDLYTLIVCSRASHAPLLIKGSWGLASKEKHKGFNLRDVIL